MASVPEPRRVLTVWLGIGLLLGAVVVTSAVVDVDRRVSGRCRLRPLAQWTLVELRPGTLESKAIDYTTGQTLHYQLYQFERDAFVELQLPQFESEVDSRIHYDSGRPLAHIEASSLALMMAERRTALERARARLAALEAGAKPEERRRAEVALEQARASLEAYRPRYQRQQGLHAERLVSDDVWEEIEATYRLRELDVELARRELDVITSGARPEEIEAARVLVNNLESELDVQSRMMSAQEVSSPVSGWLRVGGPDQAMVTVTDLDSMVVEIALPQRHSGRPEPGNPVQVWVPGLTRDVIDGCVLRVDRRAALTARGAYVTVCAAIPNPGGILEEGLEGRATIRCGRTSLLTQWMDDLSTLVRRELAGL